MTESVLLALAGAVAGMGLAYGVLSAIVSTNASAFPRLADARIDLAACVFALICAALAATAGTLPPALRATAQSSIGHAHGFRTAARGFGGSFWRRGLITFELALAVLVLVLAGVLIRSVVGLNNVNAGFIAENVLTFSVALPQAKYQRPEQVAGATDALLQRLHDLPGVASVAAGNGLPIGEAPPAVVFSSSPTAPSPQYRPAFMYSVTPDYARTLGLVVREGRFIEAGDAGSAAAITVLNESLAGTLFPDGRAIGRFISRVGSQKPVTVVGVVANVRQAGPLRPPAPAFYLPIAQVAEPFRALGFAIRSTSTPGRLAPLIRRAVSETDPEVPAFAIRSGVDLLNGTIAVHRFNMLVVGVFAVFALTLAISGLYGVLAHAVQQARRDFGIRQALGATVWRIVRSVLASALVPAVVGIVAGSIGAWAASEVIASLLFGVEPNDPATLAMVALVVVAASGAAVTVPALRAARVDLVALLRHE